MSSNVIFIPLHISDFLGGTVTFDARELGAYTSLILAHYQAGEDGLPFDEKALARIARVSDKVWRRIRDKILPKFQIVIHPATGQNFLVNDRCVEEIREIERKRAQNSSNALKGWQKRGAIAKQPQSGRNAIQNPKPNIPPYSPPETESPDI